MENYQNNFLNQLENSFKKSTNQDHNDLVARNLGYQIKEIKVYVNSKLSLQMFVYYTWRMRVLQ